MKKIIALLVTLLTVLSLSACNMLPALGTYLALSQPVYKADEEVFKADGLEITLTEAFTETDMEGFTACYDSSEVAVFVLKEDYASIPQLSDLSLEEYADLVHEANADRSPDAITETDGLTSMEYEFYNEDDSTNYKYFSTMFKGEDAFWLVQFAVDADDYEEYKPYFIEWAKSVKFTDGE